MDGLVINEWVAGALFIGGGIIFAVAGFIAMIHQWWQDR